MHQVIEVHHDTSIIFKFSDTFSKFGMHTVLLQGARNLARPFDMHNETVPTPEITLAKHILSTYVPTQYY